MDMPARFPQLMHADALGGDQDIAMGVGKLRIAQHQIGIEGGADQERWAFDRPESPPGPSAKYFQLDLRQTLLVMRAGWVVAIVRTVGPWHGLLPEALRRRSSDRSRLARVACTEFGKPMPARPFRLAGRPRKSAPRKPPVVEVESSPAIKPAVAEHHRECACAAA